MSIIGEDYKEDEKLITKEEVIISEDEINTHSFNLTDCTTIEFVIKPEEEIEVYMIDSNQIEQTGHITLKEAILRFGKSTKMDQS